MPTLKTLVRPSQNLTIKFLYARALGFAACRSALPLSQSETTERTSGRKKVREKCFFPSFLKEGPLHNMLIFRHDERQNGINVILIHITISCNVCSLLVELR